VTNIIAMLLRGVAIAVCIAACGEVADHRTPADAALDAAVDAAIPPDAPLPRKYTGGQDVVPSVTFGGPSMTIVYCMYTITLKELEIELAILPSGQVTDGRVQDLNVEAVIVSTTPNCPATIGVIPQNIATYMLESTKPAPGGQLLTFKGAPTNKPRVTLAVELAIVGSAYQAKLGFHRNDQLAPFDWSVVTTLSLSPK
jgi:hypothetical protein